MRTFFFLLMLSAFIFSGIGSSDLYAQDEYVATTVGNPQITKDNLAIHLKPLFKEELEVEAKAWLAFFRTKVAEKSVVDLQAKTATDAEKEKLVTQSAEMGTEISGLSTMFNIVIKALEAKGGDAAVYKTYISETTGMDVGFDPKQIWIQVKTWVVAPSGGLAVGLNILKFVVTLLIFFVLARVLAGITRKAVSGIKKTSALLK
ncbi:MAG: hypothetical protein KJ645_01320, partial [Planctomycetes bacterium]|nr:hypothetical protein [Planctomycetota bacterium]